MKKHLTIYFLLIVNLIHAQTNEVWDAFHKNDRQLALEQIEKIAKKDKSLETKIAHQLIRTENGYLEETFPVVKDNDFQYYLYALWNQPFFFGDYLSIGFYEQNNKVLDDVVKHADISSKTIEHAVTYLQAVRNRSFRDWDGYVTNEKKIGAITTWQYCGVFENLNESGLDIPYEPEANAFSEDGFNARSNGIVNWYKTRNNGHSYQFFENHEEYGSGIHYAQTFIESPTNQRTVIRLGRSSAMKVWLNDQLIFKNIRDVDTDLDAFSVEVNLPQGTNRLLIKNAEGNGSTSYFMVRITDINGENLSNLSFSNEYKEYNKSTKEEINPVENVHEVEQFFIDKLKEKPNDFLPNYCLAQTYLRNGKYEKAKEILLPIYEKFPKSSLIRKTLKSCYLLERNYPKSEELNDNILLDDPNYPMSLIQKFRDQSEMQRMDVQELEEYTQQITNNIRLDYLEDGVNMFLNARKQDIDGIKKNLKDIMSNPNVPISLQRIMPSAYGSIFNDEEGALKKLEQLNKERFEYRSVMELVGEYKNRGEQNKAISLYEDLHPYLKGSNSFLMGYASLLMNYDMYDEAEELIDEAIANYPYSFRAFKEKAAIALNQNDQEKALKYYQMAQVHNPEDLELKKKIQDLSGEKELIEEYLVDDIYEYARENKGEIDDNLYGYNILLDQLVFRLLEDSGARERFVQVYEITSQEGVDNFKEHSLNLYGDFNIIKTELVKSDGRIVSADRSYNNLVFKGLEVGDIIHIDYEINFVKSGRFYKDYSSHFQLGAFSPCLVTDYTIIVPKSKNFNYTLYNNAIEPTIEEIEDHTVYRWYYKTDDVLPQIENYMPHTEEIASGFQVSTIQSWNDIAFWYSDLVRSQIETDRVVQEAFDQIFPNGHSNLSELERAKNIYDYLINNLTYSYVDFRQSNYIPQKPSKTITTKLGDCKDFSTLYMTLAQMADLEANLMLVLTNDYPKTALALPNINFNHCIVKVFVNDNPIILELTDKNLPFNAKTTALINAMAMDIPYQTDSSLSYEPFALSEDLFKPSELLYNVEIMIDDSKDYEYKMDLSTTGGATSLFSRILEESDEQERKDYIENMFKNNTGQDLSLTSFSAEDFERGKHEVQVSVAMEVNEPIQTVGKLNLFQLPRFQEIYGPIVIDEAERNYPMEYHQYEFIDKYEINYSIELSEKYKFTEIPESVTNTFNKHKYELNYNLINDNELNINLVVHTDKGRISTESYPRFKEYVKGFLENEDVFIGFERK